MSDKIGILNEQGDLGLGFDEILEKEQKKVEESKDKK